MKIYKVVVGNNFDNWLVLAPSFEAAVIKARKKRIETKQEITKIELIGEAE